jgi:acetyl esterase/lipase
MTSRVFSAMVDGYLSNNKQKRTVQERRAMIDRRAERFVRPVRGVRVEPVRVEGIVSEWHIPENPIGKVILYLHGGAYTICSPATHRSLASRLVRASQASLLMIAYRLAPEHPFPAALEDALTAYRWLLKQGHKPEDVIVAGDSAGGGLAAATVISLRDHGEPLPAKLVLLSPWVDVAAAPRLGTQYAKEAELINPLVSPIYADMKGLPETLIQVGGAEYILTESRKLEQKMKAAGVKVKLEVFDGMFHVFQVFAPMVPEAQPAIEKIGVFIREK